MRRIRQRIIATIIVVFMLLTIIPTVPAHALSTAVEVPFYSKLNFTLPNGTTTSSNSYRIPAMITLSDGTIVAAADIRWNTTYDGGGLDTLTARSSDGGVTWEYTVANYLGDNGNQYNGLSTAFIDPCLVLNRTGDTVYMLVDLYPYGIALNGSGNKAPSSETGFDGNGNLLLSNDSHKSYGYYLNLEDYIIYSTNGNSTNIQVDPYFNYTTNGVTTNLFYENSTYKVARTGFLYLTSSTNGGASWSVPTLLNMKNGSELVCLVGPGRGVTTSNGVMVIPVYSYNGGENTQEMGFLYSTDGTNWSRINSNLGIWSSESAVIELENGLRFFFRNGQKQLCYVDYSFTSGWGVVQYTGIATNSNTQISAISYSQKSNGKQVILVSCPISDDPSGSNDSKATYRTNGRIFVFTNEGSTMSLANTITVNTGSFMYSCLTERSDGSVAILYEDHENNWGTGDYSYYTMDMKAYAASELGVTFGDSGDNEGGGNEGGDVEEPGNSQTITLMLGETKEVDPLTGSVGTAGAFTTTDGVVQYEIAHTANGTHQDSTATRGTNSNFAGETIDLHEALYTFTGNSTSGYTIQNGSVYLGIDANRSAGFPGSTTPETLELLTSTLTSYGQYSFIIKIKDQERYLYFWRNPNETAKHLSFDRQSSADSSTTVLLYAPVGEDHYSSYELPGYYQIQSLDEIKSGGQYLIVAKYGSTYCVLYPSTDTVNRYSHVVKATKTAITCTDDSVSETTISFTGLKPGQTTVTIGDCAYTIIVQAQEETIRKQMRVSTTSVLDPVNDLGLTGNDYDITYQVTSGTSVSVDAVGNLTSGTDLSTTKIIATVKLGNTVYGTVNYEVTVSEVTIDDNENIYLHVDKQATISGLSGELYTALLDTDIATVTPDSATNTTSITINGVTAGKTEVIVGTTRFNIYVSPKNTDPTRENTSKYAYIKIDEIRNCTVYYSINGGALYLLEGTGILMDQAYYGGFSISFFAAPDDGYALTSMGSTNSNSQYYTLTYTGDISNSPAWPLEEGGASYKKDPSGFQWALKQGNVTPERLKEVFDEAIALGCHGALTFTKNDNGSLTGNSGNNLSTELTFRAEKLPEFSKSIIGYKRGGTPSAADVARGKLTISGYTDFYVFDDSVVLDFGDTLLYEFTVTSTSSDISYGDIALADNQIGFSVNIANDTFNEPDVYSYYATYEIKTDDIGMYTGGKFVNRAELNYNYSSQYSTGSYGGVASATATCDIIGVVSYTWEDGTPQAIIDNVDGRYSLPESFSLMVGGTFRISPYSGQKTYTEMVDGIEVTWTYSEEWGVRRYGSTEKTWFLVSSALNADFTMAQSRSITFYGRWLANYSVVYKWVGEHPDIAPPEINSYQVGEEYIVDNTVFPLESTYNDGLYTWTFHGWQQEGSNIVSNGTTQTIGDSHVTYYGTWTKVANASSLTISKTGCDATDENQSFLFHISGDDLELDVVIHGNGTVIITGLTVGQTYTVTEDTSWSWRYTPEDPQQTITISPDGNSLVFDNDRSNSSWLSGGAWCDNRYTKTN